MPTNHRKLKSLSLIIGGVERKCQVQNWQMINNTPDGERFYTFCDPGADGEFREEAEPDWALQVRFFASWVLDGISDYLTQNDQATAAFVLDHHPDIPGEHVRWAGDLTVKAPTAGGEARTTEMTEVTLQCIGKPLYSRP